MRIKLILVTVLSFCALTAGAQTLTATYVQLADSADYYIKNKKWDEAENVIIKALRHEPANKSNYLLWSNLGIVRENMENFQGAIEAYTIGLASAPKSTVLLINRARSFIAVNNTEEALNDLSLVLDVDSTLQWPLKMRGILRAAKGRSSEAKKDLEKYVKIYGNDASVSETLGNIEVLTGNLDDAVKYYKEAYELDPTAELASKIGFTAYSSGKIEEVSDYISESIKKFPREGKLYLLRALLNRARYQTEAYESDLKSALHLGVDKELINKMINY